MKLGSVYPQVELSGDTAALDRMARASEALGCDHFLMYDHVVGAVHENRDPPLWELGPYTQEHPFHEPFVAFGYLAGITQRIHLITGVLILPQRQTVLVAKQAAEIDLLSGGRLHLGVGTGWNHVEYDALGVEFKTRGPRLTEQITYLRHLWEEPLVTFAGRFDAMDRGSILPRPKRRIPIYGGGFSEPALRRGAALADGFIFAGAIHDALRAWERMRELLQINGRTTAEFRPHYLVQNFRGHGLPVQEGLEALHRWRDAGGTHASIVTMGLGYRTAEQHLDHLAEVLQRMN